VATRLDSDSIGVVADVFIELFTRLSKNQPQARFLEVLCGFVYAVQKTKRTLEFTGVLTAKELSEIDWLLACAAGADTEEQANGLQDFLQCMEGEEE
jgi:hypothetical protein